MYKGLNWMLLTVNLRIKGLKRNRKRFKKIEQYRKRDL
jgi:hypothetical protein